MRCIVPGSSGRASAVLVIVVNMFLTGFDATTLNTLWVDKNLRAHGLIQAYSRTNRILNSVKTYGNIVTFRDLEEETNDAIALFGNKDARGIVLLKPYGDYYDEYAEKVDRAARRSSRSAQPIVGEAAQKEFIALFGAILRLQNILTSFDDFAGNEILTERQSAGLPQRLPRPLRRVPQDAGRREGVDQRRRRLRDRADQAGRDQRRLHPHARRRSTARPRATATTRRSAPQISRADRLQPDAAQQEGPHRGLRRLASPPTGEIDEEWRAFVEAQRDGRARPRSSPRRASSRTRRERSSSAPSATAPSSTTGTAITKILPPVSRFSADGGHGEKKQRVLDKLGEFFERFFGLTASAQAD